MLQERYNRIILPFFFFTELLIVALIYLFINDFYPKIKFDLLIFSVIWAIPALYFISYKVVRTHSKLEAVQPLIKTFIIFMILYFIAIKFRLMPILPIDSIIKIIFSIGVSQFLFSISRFIFFHKYRLNGKNINNVILVTPNDESNFTELKKDILHYGYHINERIVDINQIEKKLNIILSKTKIDSIILKETNERLTTKISSFCDQNGIRLIMILNLDVLTARKIGLDIMGGVPFAHLRKEPLLYLSNRIIKRFIDIFMSILSIILVLTWLPIIVKIAQMLTYPGPLFFVQERIGRNGEKFNLYKFRTMFHSSDSSIAKKGNSLKTSQSDNRISQFGMILRKTNFDEYPQFINVFLGSMSTVGPRPHMVGEDRELAENINQYPVRRFVKPGLTGLAAIKGFRGGTNDLKLMRRRTEFDIWYLENWSILLDLKIIFITMWQMISFRILKAY